MQHLLHSPAQTCGLRVPASAGVRSRAPQQRLQPAAAAGVAPIVGAPAQLGWRGRALAAARGPWGAAAAARRRRQPAAGTPAVRAALAGGSAPSSRPSARGSSPVPAAAAGAGAAAGSSSGGSSRQRLEAAPPPQRHLQQQQHHHHQQHLAALQPSSPAEQSRAAVKAAAAAAAGAGAAASPVPRATSPKRQQQQQQSSGNPWPRGTNQAADAQQADLEQPPEIGIVPEVLAPGGSTARGAPEAAVSAVPTAVAAAGTADVLYPPSERSNIRDSWARLMRWSRVLRNKDMSDGVAAMEKLEKVVVFGGGSFGTAMGVALARKRADLQVALLLRDPYLCRDINEQHCNTRYLKDYTLPPNVYATTSAGEAISGAQFAIHAVPVQSSRAFLQGIRDMLPPSLPLISVSKGVELSTGRLMSDVIPSALGRKQPAVFLSGPSFAKEVMDNRPTGVVAASRDRALARQVQALFASPAMRVNITDDVVGVEICGALKNVLAIAAGIVEGLELGHNAMAALISQGCSEIRWLAEKMHAKPTTISGLSGLGDIMLTCYGSLSRNRSVGVRLGQGEQLADILASSSQVAEGVATAGVVVSLARKYRVQLPVLTAVAQVLDGHISPREAVFEIMNLPQIEER